MRYPPRSFVLVGLVLFHCGSARAELEITELMIRPNNANVWEWLEVRNTSALPIDLDGYFLGKLGETEIPTGTAPDIDDSLADNTVIPAGGVAVLYDADIAAESPGNFNDQAFRDAWGLSAATPIIAVQDFPRLPDDGTAIGLWPDRSAHNDDLINDDGTYRIGVFDHAEVSIDYRSGFPELDGKASISWDGTGSFQSGGNWFLNTNGLENAVLSDPVVVQGGQLNNTDDIGNPGVVPSGSISSGLLLTEIMYNPASDEPDWEWIEVFNNTGQAIDFDITPYVLDDDDYGDINAANITEGVIPNASAAVLYNSDIELADMQQAWDPGGSLGTVFIAVDAWPALANTGDVIGIWSSYSDYTSETTTGSGRSTDNAAAAIEYDSGGDWPSTNNKSSIFLAELSATPTNPSNWSRSSTSDGLSDSASPVYGTVLLHEGGDVGSPGTAAGGAGPVADRDLDGDVDLDDLLSWQRNDGSAARLAAWRAEFGTGSTLDAARSIPEPASVVFVLLSLVTVGLNRRRH